MKRMVTMGWAALALVGCAAATSPARMEYDALRDRATALQGAAAQDASANQAKAQLLLDYTAWANKYSIQMDRWKREPRPGDGVCKYLTENGGEQCVNTNPDKVAEPCEYFCVAIPPKGPKKDL
jgi:hypothetical protein